MAEEMQTRYFFVQSGNGAVTMEQAGFQNTTVRGQGSHFEIPRNITLGFKKSYLFLSEHQEATGMYVLHRAKGFGQQPFIQQNHPFLSANQCPFFTVH